MILNLINTIYIYLPNTQLYKSCKKKLQKIVPISKKVLLL